MFTIVLQQNITDFQLTCCFISTANNFQMITALTAVFTKKKYFSFLVYFNYFPSSSLQICWYTWHISTQIAEIAFLVWDYNCNKPLAAIKPFNASNANFFSNLFNAMYSL